MRDANPRSGTIVLGTIVLNSKFAGGVYPVINVKSGSYSLRYIPCTIEGMNTLGIGGLGDKGGIPCPFNNGDSGWEGLDPSPVSLSVHVDTILAVTNSGYVL